MNLPAIYSSKSQESYDNYNLFEPQLKTFLEDSEQTAHNILFPRDSHLDDRHAPFVKQRPRVSVICYSLGVPYRFGNSYSLFGNSYSLMTVNNFSPQSSNQGKDDSARVIIGIVGAVAAGIAAYVLGGVMNAHSNIMTQVKEIKFFKNFIDEQYYKDTHHTHLNAIKSIIDCQDGIFERIKQHSNRKIALLVSCIVAGSFMTIGAIAASHGLMIAGTILGFGTMVGALFNWSYSVNAKPTAQEAKTMLALLDTLKKANERLPLDPQSVRVHSLSAIQATERGSFKTSDDVPLYALQNPKFQQGQSKSNSNFTFNETLEPRIAN